MIEPVESGPVRGFFHRANISGTALLLAHGAGSDCNARLLQSVAGAFAGAGVSTLRIDLPFRQTRPKGPPHPSFAAGDRDGIRAAVAWLREAGYARLAIGGHSYGGRQASMLASEDDGIADALLLFSYPLHPPARPEQKRTAHWPDLRIPTLFVHGTRDPFGSPEEVRASTAILPARHELLLIEGAGHELKPVVQRPATVVEACLAFMATAAFGATGASRNSSNPQTV